MCGRTHLFIVNVSEKVPESDTNEKKEAEIHLALVVACHCSILAIDHVGEVISKYGQGSVLSSIVNTSSPHEMRRDH